MVIMIKKKYYSWSDVERMCNNIVLQMYYDNWKPDYIVGITRGGNVPATIISNMTGIRCESLKVALRDGEGHQETNCWMSEDAFGYVDEKEREILKTRWDISKRKNILVVDDINDTGSTFNWIKEDWQASCLPSSEGWDKVWGKNVRFAVLTENLSSEFDGVSYSCDEVNKAEEDVWLVYPWENVGEYNER
jgi:hypoxanthine phosphoribosyltransferase